MSHSDPIFITVTTTENIETFCTPKECFDFWALVLIERNPSHMYKNRTGSFGDLYIRLLPDFLVSTDSSWTQGPPDLVSCRGTLQTVEPW
jgi:hypothetical protein